MDRLTRALYASSAAAVLSLMAMVMVMLVASVPGFRLAEDRARAAKGAPAVMVSDIRTDLRAG